jgi:hypothetical protein
MISFTSCRCYHQLVIISLAFVICVDAFSDARAPFKFRETWRQHPTFLYSALSSADYSDQENGDSKTWEDYFEEYCNCTLETGESNIPLHHTTLGNWVRNQRKHYKQWQQGIVVNDKTAVQTPKRLRLLEDSGFIFDVAEHEWMQHYQQLQAYREVHGHCRVAPQKGSSCKEDVALLRWVRTQRTKYRKGTLSEDRIELLEAIDFCWNPYEWAYRENVKQVVESNKSIWDFKNTDGPLGLWMSRQRTQYRKYCSDDEESGLQEYQIELLEMELGMDCTSFTSSMKMLPRPPLDIEWADRMRQLDEFKDEHGHLNVPRTYTKYKNLGAWVAKVRERYRFHGGHSSERIQSRLEDLFEIGFIWDVCEYRWQNQFSHLIDFYEQHGHAHVPDSLAGLGPWVREQRHEYHKFRRGEPSRLTPKHAMALNRIGLDWNRQSNVRREQDNVFEERVDEYVKYMKHNPGASTASMPKTMRNWVERQRKLYRKWLQGEHDMIEERRYALEDIGVVQGVTETDRK